MASVDISMEKINKLNKLKHEALCMTEVFVCALNSRELNCIEHYISNSKMIMRVVLMESLTIFVVPCISLPTVDLHLPVD